MSGLGRPFLVSPILSSSEVLFAARNKYPPRPTKIITCVPLNSKCRLWASQVCPSLSLLPPDSRVAASCPDMAASRGREIGVSGFLVFCLRPRKSFLGTYHWLGNETTMTGLACISLSSLFRLQSQSTTS